MSSASNRVGRWLEPVIVPAVFDFWVQKLNPLLSWERCLARVVERHREARDTVTLVLQANRHFPGFLPGQHLNLSVEIDGVRLTRCYSPVCPDRGDRRVTLTVHKQGAGKVSSWLVDQAAIGDVVELGPGPAFGDMRAEPHGAGEPWLMVAGGSGITPLICMIRDLLARDPNTRITLMHWVRSHEDLYFQSGLSDLQARCPGFRFLPVFTRAATLLPGELSGRPEAHHFAGQIQHLDACRVRVCGPADFVSRVSGLLGEAVAELVSERFSLPPSGVEAGAPVSVTLARSGRQVQVPAGVPLLDALEAVGLRPDYGCRRGICNTCVCQKQAGTTVNLVDGSRQSEAGPLRLCVSAASADLTIDL